MKKHIIHFFYSHPNSDECFSTSDGFLFRESHAANAHADSLENKKVEKYSRTSYADDVKKYADDLQLEKEVKLKIDADTKAKADADAKKKEEDEAKAKKKLEDETAAAIKKAKGDSEDDGGKAAGDETPDESWKVQELKDYCQEKGIALDGSEKTKKDVLAKIEAAKPTEDKK